MSGSELTSTAEDSRVDEADGGRRVTREVYGHTSV